MNKLERKQIVKDIRKKLKEIDELLEQLEKEDEESKTEKSLEQIIAQELTTIGVPANIKGYKYLSDAVMLVVENPDYIYSITTLLYPEVAEKNNTTDQKVERCIRTAIEKVFSNPNEKKDGIFRNTIDPVKGKTTNSEFIEGFAEYCKT